MLLSLFFVVQTTLLSASTGAPNAEWRELSERTKRIIQDEISVNAKSQKRGAASGELFELKNSYFMDPTGNWVDSSDDYYWDEKWTHFNCYAYAMQRYDIVPSFYPPYYGQEDVDEYGENQSRWYHPGQISLFEEPDHYLTVHEHVERVVSDFNMLGYGNVSASRFNGYLPLLAPDEELIAVRTSMPPGDYDFHFMRYNKFDGCWYHKVGPRNILKYKYPLSEQRVWTNEYPGVIFDAGGEVSYSSEIWLVRYTPTVYRPSIGSTLQETLYLDNIGDRVVTLDIATSGRLDLSFYNINGFMAILYTNEWDSIGAATYQPISVDVPAGRYYLVMKNYRYSDNVYITVSLSNIRGNANPRTPQNMFAIAEDDRLILGKVVDGKSAEITIMPTLTDSNGNYDCSEVE